MRDLQGWTAALQRFTAGGRVLLPLQQGETAVGAGMDGCLICLRECAGVSAGRFFGFGGAVPRYHLLLLGFAFGSSTSGAWYAAQLLVVHGFAGAAVR